MNYTQESIGKTKHFFIKKGSDERTHGDKSEIMREGDWGEKKNELISLFLVAIHKQTTVMFFRKQNISKG